MSKNRRFFVFKLSTNGKTDYMISLAATILHNQKVVLNLAVDFHSRRFVFRGGRMMKKFKSQLFQRTNSSLLALSLLVASSCGVSPVQMIPLEYASLPLQSTGLKNQH
jgi:hypothetical protein